MMNTVTIEEMNLAVLVNELVKNDGPIEDNGLIVDMILTLPQHQLDDASRMYCEIGLPVSYPEYHQETGEILIDEIFSYIQEECSPSDLHHRASFAYYYLNATPISGANFRSEVKELFEAETWSEVKEEWSDVLYMGYCLLYQNTGIDLKMRGARPSVQKFVGRMTKWKGIFKACDLRFEKWYLVGGSNCEKMSKIQAAVDMATAAQHFRQHA